jgi:Tfp pilus assembly protein PilF
MNDIPEMLRTGVEHHRSGRLPQAEQLYRQVLQIHPRHAGAIHLLGLIAFQIGKHDVAAEYLLEAIKIDAFHAPFSADLAEIYRAMGKTAEAIASYRQALRLNPEAADTHNYFGTMLVGEGQADEATACFREAVRLNPRFGEAHANLGAVYQAQGQLAAAQAAFEQAVQVASDDAGAYLGLGTCLRAQGKWPSALACYQKAARLRPELPEAHYFAGMARLALGQFAEGWPEFQWRLKCATGARRAYPLPMWNGALLQGQRVLVHADGDLGDTLQFIRYVPLVVERGASVVLDVQPDLAPLVAQSGFAQWILAGEPPADCQLQAPLLSLPGIFGTTLETIPAAVPYLHASPGLLDRWSQKLTQLGGFKIGIAWQGEASGALARFGSIPLGQFQSLAAVSGVRLIGLQVNDRLNRPSVPVDAVELVDLGDQLNEPEGAFMHLAAIMAHLDLVVTCDAAVAHLAGALGEATWVALSTAADWRWLRDRDDSPWYPSVRLFRQTAPGDWSDVFARMAGELEGLVAKHAAARS